VQASPELEQFVRELLDAYSRGEGEALLGMVADSPLVVIGTLEREWTEGRDELERMYAHEVLDPHTTCSVQHMAAYEQDDSGWFVGRVVYSLPGGVRIRARVSGAAVRDVGSWTLVHLHSSVGR
jgi:hypothetical protein